MTLQHRGGNLFASELPALGHGCNCAGAMGKGIAVEFRRRWPAMFEEYKRRCADGSFKPGDLLVWEAADRVVFNLGTQRTWRTKAELWAIEKSVRKMIEWAEQHGVPGVALPRIGAGLGGLAWRDVAATLDSVAATTSVEVVVFELTRSI